MCKIEIYQDNIYHISVGTQTNCAGIAKIIVRMTKINELNLLFQLADHLPEDLETSFYTPGREVPEIFTQAILRGAKHSIEQNDYGSGLQIELLAALIHPVDAHTKRFEEAGFLAVQEWLKNN